MSLPSGDASSEKRSRRGCSTCRKRRVKCDEFRPICGGCQRMDRPCEWPYEPYPPAPEQSIRSQPIVQRHKACDTCRLRKIRCVPSEIEGAPCARCSRLVRPCSFAETNAMSRQQGSPKVAQTVAPNPLEGIMGDRQEVLELTTMYFKTVHQYGFLAFVHEPSFRRLVDENKAPRNLTLMMMACALRVSGVAASMKRADGLFDEYMASLKRIMFTGYGAVELMAVMLAQVFEHSRGKLLSSWMMTGVAVRMMQFHCLHNFDEMYGPVRAITLNPLLKREALRRLAWSCWFLDTMVDAGRFSVHNLDERGFRIRLPASDESFVRGRDEATPTLMDARTDGLDLPGYFILVATLRRRMTHFNSYNLKYGTVSLEQVNKMEDDLQQLVGSLPSDLTYNQENLYVNSGRLTTFVLFHVLIHSSLSLASRMRKTLAETDPAQTPSLETYGRDRIRHAVAVAGIVADALRLGVHIDPCVGFQSYAAIEVLLLEPLKLRQLGLAYEDHDAEIKPLLQVVRNLSPVFVVMRHLRVEACARLLRYGRQELLTEEDTQLLSNQRLTSDPDEPEFTFEAFRWHRLEHLMQRDPGLEAPTAVEALLDLGAADGSRVDEPVDVSPQGVDAGALTLPVALPQTISPNAMRWQDLDGGPMLTESFFTYSDDNAMMELLYGPGSGDNTWM